VAVRSEVSPKASKRGDGGRAVEIGANRQPCDPSITLLFKLVLEAVLGVLVLLAACAGKKIHTVGTRFPARGRAKGRQLEC